MNSRANTSLANLLDFNTALPQENTVNERLNTEQIKSELLNRIEDVLFYLFPNGKIEAKQFKIGSIKGEQGKSLTIELSGAKSGIWHDFATGDGGDIFDLWREVMGYQKSEFAKLLTEINEWLGYHLISRKDYKKDRKENYREDNKEESVIKTNKGIYFDDLGKPTGKWDYLDQNNKLIAVVYRYDTRHGKEFRVWDVKNKKALAPDPRPLYNLPGIITTQRIILVEGEKSAEALNQIGFVATTAMCGANAPLDKTDWSPLKDKEVIIWPDNDQAGINYAHKLTDHLKKIAEVILVLTPPEDKPEKWDAYDAVLENDFNINEFLLSAKPVSLPIIRSCLGKIRHDQSQMPEDLVSPRLLTPGGILLIGGAPKVGKSDFLINFLVNLAAGKSFLGFTPPRPLKIFYLQAEIGYHYLRERIQKLPITNEILCLADDNLVITSPVQMILDDNGVDTIYRTITQDFPNQVPDIICIDPIRNLFDGGPDSKGENDNNSMLFFLQNRIEKLRSMLNRELGIILCHHTKKIKKKDVEEDPFQAFSGASSLRSFYSSGLILHRPNEEEAKIEIYCELRNGPAITKKIVEKFDGKWIELNAFSERLIRKNYGEKLDAERNRKTDVILQLIADEALKGRLYTSNQFAQMFEGEAGLGGKSTINDRISILATKGYIKYIHEKTGFPSSKARSKYGILCVENMEFKNDNGTSRIMLPSHYKCPNSGAVLPVENPSVWVYHDDEV